MSTLNITPHVRDDVSDSTAAAEVARADAAFEALVRSAGPVLDPTAVEFATVFDLDYGDRRLALVVPQQRTAGPRRTTARRAPAPAPARSRVRLTRRGRLTALLVFLGAALAVLLTLGGFSAVATRDAGSPPPVRVVTVHAGDTLYGIAADLAAPGHIRETVHQIQELNSLSSSSLSEGQKLAVPRG